MNITLFIGSLSGGGAERVTCNLANFLSAKHNVKIITMSGDAPTYYLDPSIERICLENETENYNFIKRNILRFFRLRKLLKNYKSDVYVVMLPVTTALLLLHRKYIDAPIIASERNDPKNWYKKSLIHRLVMEKLYSKADLFVFQTEDAKKFYKSTLKIDGIVIPNAINEEFIDVSIHKDKNKKIVSVGRFSEQKNFSMLIKSFNEIQNEFPDYTLEIYGDGPLRNDLEKLIDKYNLHNKVFLQGYVENIKSYIENASLFVLPSNFEGMPNALMEAMAMGIPSIATDCPVGGPRFLINDGENGFLVPVGDSELLAKKIKLLLSDESISKKISKKAQDITKKLHPNLIYGHWECVIQESIKNYRML